MNGAYKLMKFPWPTDSDEQYNEKSSPFRVLVKIIERFAADARMNGARPVVIMFADNYSYKLPYFNETGLFMHNPLLTYLEQKNIAFVDVSKGLLENEEFPIDALIPGHYNERGNQIAASYLDQELAPLISQILEQKAVSGPAGSREPRVPR